MNKIISNTDPNLEMEFELLKPFLTKMEISAMNCEIPMTQEIYDSIMDKFMEMGSITEELFFNMLLDSQYDAFMIAYARKMEGNLDKEYPPLKYNYK